MIKGAIALENDRLCPVIFCLYTIDSKENKSVLDDGISPKSGLV